MTLATLTDGPELVNVPEYVRQWIAQILDPETLELLRHGTDRQVDLRLSANAGKVRRRPVVAFDAGPQEYVGP